MDAPSDLLITLLAAAGLTLQDAGSHANAPIHHVWIANNLGGPLVAVGSTSEETAVTALARL
jgi:hypothetical protein